MALSRFGFIVVGAGLCGRQNVMRMESPDFLMITCGVGQPEHVVEAARGLVAEGVQLIELCGGFGPTWTARVIEAIDGAVPVGAVGYGPECLAPMHALFSPAPVS